MEVEGAGCFIGQVSRLYPQPGQYTLLPTSETFSNQKLGRKRYQNNHSKYVIVIYSVFMCVLKIDTCMVKIAIWWFPSQFGATGQGEAQIYLLSECLLF